jgi:hypothetical protein
VGARACRSLLWAPAPFGRVAPQQVEVKLIAVSLAEKGGHGAAAALQLIKLGLHDSVCGFHVAIVGGAVGRMETVLSAAGLLLDQLGEGGQAMTPIPVAR